MNAQDFFWISLSVAVWIGTGTILCLLFRWRKEDREIQKAVLREIRSGEDREVPRAVLREIRSGVGSSQNAYDFSKSTRAAGTRKLYQAE